MYWKTLKNIFLVFILFINLWAYTTFWAEKILTREEVFTFFWDSFNGKIPKTYEYIDLKFQWVNKETPLYEALQKLVYLDKIENTNTNIQKNQPLSQYAFYMLAQKIYDLKLDYLDINFLKQEQTDTNDLEKIKRIISQKSITIKWTTNKKSIEQKKAIFQDVYATLLQEHYNKNNINEEKVLESAIEWVAKWMNDKYTVYFPPTESQGFYDTLSWEYEWIGSYVDMEKPWIVRIVSPITWSPSQEAWLKWGDIIIKVDEKEVTKENSLQEVVSWIKWPAETQVLLTIKRWQETLEIKVTRAKITIKDVEYKLLDYSTFYIEIKSFWDHVSQQFKEALEELKKNKWVKKVIIDLRNNGGGYLWEVSDMLWYFVEKWEPTAVVKYIENERKFLSTWYDLIDFSKYKLILLQNSWTASASEIMIGTIKDYYPEAEIVWEKSFGKGSVQAIKDYVDGSTVKYTIAKWFTWLSQTGIDGIWIQPTIEVEFDVDLYKINNRDNQLERAKNLY
jgi:carboxyl-terminal processing protease